MSDENSSAERNSGQALVLSGGGARAAYQVGCLRAVSKALPNYRPQILTGVSAGAINATYLAAFQGSLADSVEALVSFGNRCEPIRYIELDWPQWWVEWPTGVYTL